MFGSKWPYYLLTKNTVSGRVSPLFNNPDEDLKMKRYLRINSYSQPGVHYQIDLQLKTCSCTSFSKAKDCKHLDAVCCWPPKTYIAPSHPTFSQALSGLVKSIRLRRTADAVKWMLYCDHMPQPGGRFRIARRLLIGSVEDGHSLAVMERTAKNFPHLAKSDVHLIEMAAEIIRICRIPNWWHPSTGGPDYIYSGMVAWRLAALYKQGGVDHEDALIKLEEGINDQNAILVMAAVERLMAFKKLGRTALVEYLLGLAKKYNNEIAERLCNIHLMNKSALSNDSNCVMQASWILGGGVCNVVDAYVPVMATEARQMLVEQFEEMRKYQPIPLEYLDGIHCGGADKRYAGMWHYMNAVCECYKLHGNVEPSNVWLRRFHNLDGLEVEELGNEELEEGGE